jgi:cell division protein FtsB
MGRPRAAAPGREVEGPTRKLTPRAAVLAALLTVVSLFAVAPARAYLEQRARIAELERRAAILARANARLEAEIQRLRDPSEIERLARECLGMVRPGEIAFLPVTKGGGRLPPRC